MTETAKLRKELETAISDLYRVRTARNKYRERLNLMTKQTYVSVTLNFLFIIALTIALVFSKEASGAPGTNTPDHVLASVRMSNGNFRCSGTVLGDDSSDTALILSCSHCTGGHIGNSCWWHNPDGSSFRAKLEAVDKTKDLSLWSASRNDVLYYTKVATNWDEASVFSQCGYPQGRGPKVRSIEFSNEQTINNGMERYNFTVVDGPDIIGGDSGSGVFVDGDLMGVLSHNGAPKSGLPSTTLYCTRQGALCEFIEENSVNITNCPPWGCPPRNQRRNNRDQIAPRPDPRFSPEPNVPIDPPRDDRAPSPPRRRDRDRDALIADLQKQIEELRKSQQPDQELQPGKDGQPGPPGPMGPPGPQGAPGSAADIAPLLKEIALLNQRLELVEGNLKQTSLKGQDNEVATAKNTKELSLLKDRITWISNKQSELIKADRDIRLLIQRLEARVEKNDKRLKGTLQFTVRAAGEESK